MKTKITLKNIYLLLVIAIGLVGLAVGSTYAVFTASAEINDPITLVTNLTYTSDIMETRDITIGPNEVEEVIFNITNSSGGNLNYAIWYIDNGYDIDTGSETTTNSSCIATCSGMANGAAYGVKIMLKNNENTTVTITVGVASSSGDVVLPTGATAVPNGSLTRYTVQIKKKLGMGTATNVSTNTVYSGMPFTTSSSISGTSTYPKYDTVTCTNNQNATVQKTTSNGIDSVTLSIATVTNNTVCTVNFVAPTRTIRIYRQLGTETATLMTTKTVASGSPMSSYPVAGTTAYPQYDTVTCTNIQLPSVTVTTYNNIETANIRIMNVTNDSDCTVKFKQSTQSATIKVYLYGNLDQTVNVSVGGTAYIEIDPSTYNVLSVTCKDANNNTVQASVSGFAYNAAELEVYSVPAGTTSCYIT